MFTGRVYTQTGYGGRSIRFADKDGGVATTTYNYSMSDEEKTEMARRITAALNLTARLRTEDIERLAADRTATEGSKNGGNGNGPA